MKHLVKTLIYIGLGTLMAYLLFKYVAPVFAPFIVAGFLSLFIEPFVTILQKKGRMPRSIAVGIAMFFVFGGTGLVITLIITRLIVELVHLSAYLPAYIQNIKSVVMTAQNRVEDYYFTLPKEVLQFIKERIAGTSELNLDTFLSRAQILTTEILSFILQFIASVPGWIILIIISAIATYFMAKDKQAIVRFWLRAVPAPWGPKSIEITMDIFHSIISYIRAQLVLISITFVQTLVGLYIIGAPYALLMGLVVGVADLIPILGPSSIFIPWIIWQFISGEIVFAVKLTILYLVVLVVRQVLETKIVSSSIGLHPLATLISMYAGLQLLGPLGVIAGPLFIITVKAFVSAGLLGWPDEK